MILAQDGWQRGNKIFEGLNKNLVEGAIFCPFYQNHNSFKEDIKDYLEKYSGKIFFMDPYFYIFCMQVDKIGKLDSYPYFRQNLVKGDFTTRKIQEYVKEVLSYQKSLGFTYIVSPGVTIDNFDSAWAQIALQIFKDTEIYFSSSKDNKSLALLIINEDALSNSESLDDFLDEITTIDLNGYYIIIEKNSIDFPNWSDPLKLSKLMKIIYFLKQNNYQIILGYTDLVGILLKAAGCDYFANGWFLNSRQFTRGKFLESYGRQAKLLYTSAHLLNSIRIDPFLQTIHEIGRMSEVLSGLEIDHCFDGKTHTGLEDSWTKNCEILQYWETLRNLLIEIDNKEEINEKIDLINYLIDSALLLYDDLYDSGVFFDGRSRGIHLNIWKKAIENFKSEVLSQR